MQGSDAALMRNSTEELMQAWQRVGTQMHQAQEQPGNGSDTPPSSGSDEDVVEGEFHEA